MEARTLHPETAPGWRELLEALYAQIEDARAREQSALERERRLLVLLEEERRELARLRGSVRPARAPAHSPRASSELHARILEVLFPHPTGLTRAQIEAAVGTGALVGQLDGLARRGRVRRVGKGVYALPVLTG